MLPEPGHILPTIRMARLLQDKGHDVTYITVPHYEKFFHAHNFSCRLLFTEKFPSIHPNDFFGSWGINPSRFLIEHSITPEGHNLTAHLIQSLRNLHVDCLLCDTTLIRTIGGSLGDSLLQTTIAVSPGIPHQMPCACMFGIPEVILCPNEFEIPVDEGSLRTERCRAFYAEASVLIQRQDIEFPWDRVISDRAVVYCSLGTQYVRYTEAPEILKNVIRAFSLLAHYQLVLVAGSIYDELSAESTPDNVVLVRTAPQLELLKRAKLFITHGGLGGIKEAIMNGVPMLVIPFDTDQPGNAERILYHKLGHYCPPSQCTTERIIHSTLTLLENDGCCDGLGPMQRIFCEVETQSPSAQFIEQAYETLTSSRVPASYGRT